MSKVRKSPIALALSDQLEEVVRAAAKASGRTLTNEIAMRLLDSFSEKAINTPPAEEARDRSIAAFTNFEKEDVAKRLAGKVNEQTGCHIYTGSLNYSGYGAIYVSGITFATHRLAYELANGPIGRGQGATWVLHHCDTPACCNPEHLYLGTPANNARDMAMRARMRSGIRPQCRWQTEEDAMRPTGTVFWEFEGQIKELSEWSELFGINPCTLDARFRSGWPPENIPKLPVPGFKNWKKRGQSPHAYRRFSGQQAVVEYQQQKQMEAQHEKQA